MQFPPKKAETDARSRRCSEAVAVEALERQTKNPTRMLEGLKSRMGVDQHSCDEARRLESIEGKDQRRPTRRNVVDELLQKLLQSESTRGWRRR